MAKNIGLGPVDPGLNLTQPHSLLGVLGLVSACPLSQDGCGGITYWGGIGKSHACSLIPLMEWQYTNVKTRVGPKGPLQHGLSGLSEVGEEADVGIQHTPKLGFLLVANS